MQLRRLFPADWITAIRCSTVCRTFYCAVCAECHCTTDHWHATQRSSSPVLRELHWLPIRQRVKFKVHGMPDSPVAVRCLSTWPTTAVSCPTALGALCGQLTFRLARCREHSVVIATELLQPRDLAFGTLFQSSCVLPTSPTNCSDDS